MSYHCEHLGLSPIKDPQPSSVEHASEFCHTKTGNLGSSPGAHVPHYFGGYFGTIKSPELPNLEQSDQVLMEPEKSFRQRSREIPHQQL